MKFVVDECSGPALARWLRSLGHDVISVFDDIRGADDTDIPALAQREERIVITNDKDFGDLVYRQQRAHCGIVLLRLSDSRSAAKIAAVERLLEHQAMSLSDSFIVVSDRGTRVNR